LRLLDSEGNDITSSVTSGRIHGDLQFGNHFLPSLIGDGQQQGDLNRLAQGLADSMNRELGGSIRLFDYDESSPGAVAATLRVNESISSSDLLSLHVSQGGALASRLAAIPGGDNPDDQLDGSGYRDFLAGLQKSATGELAANETSLELHTRLLHQAESLRQEIQGVSLEEEAVNLLTYQRGFEAMAKVIGVVNEMTQTALALFS
jgi:flagellar hook-associated protein FlgK